MRRLFFLFGALVLFASVQANMAYMGPAPGQVSGMKVGAHVRVEYEWLTADLRNLPASKARVFANYRLQCSEKSYIRFVFVASNIDEIRPEIILNGALVEPQFRSRPLVVDSQRGQQDIGYDASSKGEPLENEIFEFDVWLNEGKNSLKIGYECMPINYEIGDISYWVFPYYLGNANTKKQYDSIYLNVLLPEGVTYESNVAIGRKTEEGFVTKNIAAFSGTHLRITLYKPIQKAVDTGLWIFQGTMVVLLVLSCVLVALGYRSRKERKKKLWVYIILYLIPGSILLSFVFFTALEYYYNYMEEQYGAWLRDSWGKGYYWLGLPFVCLFILAVWTVCILFYRVFVMKK